MDPERESMKPRAEVGVEERVWTEEVEEEEMAGLVESGFKGFTRTRLVRAHPGRVLLKKRFEELAEKFYNFEFRPDDIVILTYPKSGTTWMQELVWALTHLGELHRADTVPINQRCFFLDLDVLSDLDNQLANEALMSGFRAACGTEARPEDGVVLQIATCATRSAPRILKTHLPFPLFNPSLLDTCKVVYVSRDPRDVCVSYHHHCRLIDTYGFKGQFSDFVEVFLAGNIVYGDYWDHLKAASSHRHHHNLHWVTYEQLQSDVSGCITRLASFLGRTVTPHQLKQVSEHIKFDTMKARNVSAPILFSSGTNTSEGGFYRKGVSGDWANVATPALARRMNRWVQECEAATKVSLASLASP